ncbi:MAG: transposase [Rhodoplanes sp.]
MKRGSGGSTGHGHAGRRSAPPEVASQLIREYIYLYGAVSPKDGTCVYLTMPTSNTACFQAFLNVLSRRFARHDILLVLDGAPNHRGGDLAVPGNNSLLFLPPYSPELNPKENLWDEIREKIFKNYALKSIDAVRAKLKQAILYIERNPETVKSITSFPYIVRSLSCGNGMRRLFHRNRTGRAPSGCPRTTPVRRQADRSAPSARR